MSTTQVTEADVLNIVVEAARESARAGAAETIFADRVEVRVA